MSTSVDIMSTSRDIISISGMFSISGGYHEACGGYHEHINSPQKAEYIFQRSTGQLVVIIKATVCSLVYDSTTPLSGVLSLQMGN